MNVLTIAETAEEAVKIDKFFIGLKIDWLKSKSLLSYCKFLKEGQNKYLQEAIRFSKVVLDSLSNEDGDYHSLSFREKISFPGPSPFIKDIIGDMSKYNKITKLFNYVAYFESDESRFVIVFPTNLSFYF